LYLFCTCMWCCLSLSYSMLWFSHVKNIGNFEKPIGGCLYFSQKYTQWSHLWLKYRHYLTPYTTLDSSMQNSLEQSKKMCPLISIWWGSCQWYWYIVFIGASCQVYTGWPKKGDLYFDYKQCTHWKINVFEHFKYQKNRAASTVLFVFEAFEAFIDFLRTFSSKRVTFF